APKPQRGESTPARSAAFSKSPERLRHSMRIPPGIRRAFRLPVTSDRIVRDLDDEVRLHVELRVSMLMAQGLSREQAQLEALRRFGDVDDLRDYCVSIEVS